MWTFFDNERFGVQFWYKDWCNLGKTVGWLYTYYDVGPVRVWIRNH